MIVMKSVTVSKTVRGIGDEAFVNYNVRAGIVVCNATADVGAVPKLWTITVGSRRYTKRSAGELRSLTLRGRAMAKVLKAIEAGRI